MTGKGKPFALLKDLIYNKKGHLSDKYTPLIPNDIFALGDSDSTENEDGDDSPNLAWLKFIESNWYYLRKVVDGTSKGFVFLERQ